MRIGLTCDTVLHFLICDAVKQILIGGKKREGEGNFVEPTIVAIEHDAEIVQVRCLLCCWILKSAFD